MHKKGGLRIENSINLSGRILKMSSIPVLKEENYFVRDISLDGDAPKQFIQAYFYERDASVRKKDFKSWNFYIAKTAEKWYPHESIIEALINRIGQCLDLNMNEIKLVVANTQIRFLSKYFLKDGLQLVHGAEICGEYLNDIEMAKEIADNRDSARELFTFEFIKDSIRTVFPNNFEALTTELVKMIAFDAIVGNNDRHFYNWGVITTDKKSKKIPTFAPLYDSARGLLWNSDDNKIIHLYKLCKRNESSIDKYIKGAKPRISIGSNTQANHFELIDFIKRYNIDYKNIIEYLSCTENENKVLNVLKQEFFPLFIEERRELISLIIKKRFKQIREI